jgi:hypothetical protein
LGLLWGLSLRKAEYRLNDNYMCPKNNPHVSYWGPMKDLYWTVQCWQRKGPITLLQRGETASDCTLGTCNPVNFTIFNLSEPNWEMRQSIGILIDGKGEDPSTLLHFRLITITHESSTYQVFHSFYEEMKSEFPVSVKTKNLLLSLAKSIAQTLNVTSCYV